MPRHISETTMPHNVQVILMIMSFKFCISTSVDMKETANSNKRNGIIYWSFVLKAIVYSRPKDRIVSWQWLARKIDFETVDCSSINFASLLSLTAHHAKQYWLGLHLPSGHWSCNHWFEHLQRFDHLCSRDRNAAFPQKCCISSGVLPFSFRNVAHLL